MTYKIVKFTTFYIRVDRFWETLSDHHGPCKVYGGKPPEQLLFYDFDSVEAKKKSGRSERGVTLAQNSISYMGGYRNIQNNAL